MTFLDVDVIHVLERVLPERFGGGPTDYQLVEEEGVDGAPHLSLLVDPRIGPVSSDAVSETFLTAIGDGRGAEKVMSLAWQGCAAAPDRAAVAARHLRGKDPPPPRHRTGP